MKSVGRTGQFRPSSVIGLMTIDEAAERCGLPSELIHRAVLMERLPATESPDGAEWSISREDLDRFCLPLAIPAPSHRLRLLRVSLPLAVHLILLMGMLTWVVPLYSDLYADIKAPMRFGVFVVQLSEIVSARPWFWFPVVLLAGLFLGAWLSRHYRRWIPMVIVSVGSLMFLYVTWVIMAPWIFMCHL